MLESLAEDIVTITSDYHHDHDSEFEMTTDHVMGWVNQFEEADREFILSELKHILNQGVYISKAKAKELLWDFVNRATRYLGYETIDLFLGETHFISSQAEHKSQTILLGILNELLLENTAYTLETCGSIGVRNHIYLDDIIASGGKFNEEIYRYISEKNILDALKNKEVRILSYFFCIHTWGTANARYVLKNRFGEENYFLNIKDFPVFAYYYIQNNIKEYNQSLNLVYPEKTKNEYDIYLNSLDQAIRQTDRGYRKQNQPSQETFFSSKENRVRLEQIFLDKGIEIISRIQDEESKRKHRPLGKTYPSYKTFGTGTLFFCWRNISNTCPIVFWWDNPAHNWRGLFPLQNRGN